MNTPSSRPADPLFWYPLSYRDEEEEIARAEAASLLAEVNFAGPIALSPTIADPDRSAHLSARLAPIEHDESLEALIERVKERALASESFRVEVRHLHCALPENSKELAALVGAAIGGHVNLSRPRDRFLLMRTVDTWWFGKLEAETGRRWERLKPARTLSTALETRLALAAVNLARPKGTFLDPCCGSGTLVIQAASLGLNAVGADLSARMVWATRHNLQALALRALVCRADARAFSGRFDAIATDFPYGLFGGRCDSLYADASANLATVAPRAVFITSKDHTQVWEDAGYEVETVVRVPKGCLVRHLHVCVSRRFG